MNSTTAKKTKKQHLHFLLFSAVALIVPACFLLPSQIDRMLAAASASLPFAAGAVAILINAMQHDDANPHLRIMHRLLSSIFQTLTSVPFHI